MLLNSDSTQACLHGDVCCLPGVRLATTSSPPPESIPNDLLVDEETVPGYNWKAFYPALPGDLLDNRYELKTKVGWGSSSAVWLAEDISL